MRLRSLPFLSLLFALLACTDADDATVDAGRGPLDGGATLDGGPAIEDGGAPDAAVVPPPIPQGLRLGAQVELPRLGPHLGEIIPYGDVVFVANSWDMLAVYLREPDGNLLVTLPAPPWPDGVMSRCTTLSVHAASQTLFCASDEQHAVIAFDIANPERPVVRDRLALSFTDGTYARDIHVSGDHLYLSRFERGLWVAPIDPATGALGPAAATAVTGNLRFVDGTDTRVALSADAGLLLLAGEGPDTTVARSLALDGTMQDVVVRGTRAAVALGSEGVVLVDLASDPLEVIHRVVPPAVATAADVDGDALAVMTLTGAYLYDLRRDRPRLAGFVPAGRQADRNGGVMLSGRIVDGGELVTSDWTFVERWRMDLDGYALAPDLPRGFHLPPDEGVEIPLRSVSHVDVVVRTRAGAETIDTLLPAGGEARVSVDAASIAASPVENELFRIGIQALLVGAPRAFFSTYVRIRIRPPFEGDAPWERPAVGDRFPTIAYATTDNTIMHLSEPGRRERIMFFGTDCVAIWPVIEDAAYLSRAGRLDDGATAVLINSFNIGADGFATRWDLWGIPYGHYGYLAPPEVIAENGGDRLYDDRFMMRDLPAAAAHPTDFVVSEAGIVTAVDTYYRGAFPLR